jgi:AraC-like DNA-binding protein
MAKGFRTRLTLVDFDGVGCSSPALPQKLACLVCPQRDSVFFVKGACCGRLARLAEELSGGVGRSLSSVWMRQSRLAEFIARVLERPELQGLPACRNSCCPRDLQSIEQAARFLEENLDGPHSIPALSRRFFLNECKLKSGFREHYGTTVFGYLRQKRMEHAWTLLRESDATVLEVANEVGYSNPSHFARAFRDVHAINPGEVKREPSNSRLH